MLRPWQYHHILIGIVIVWRIITQYIVKITGAYVLTIFDGLVVVIDYTAAIAVKLKIPGSVRDAARHPNTKVIG